MWKIPLPDGQSLFKLHALRNLSPSLFNQKKFVSIIYILKFIYCNQKTRRLGEYLLEEEVVSDELFSCCFVHAFEWVEGTSEVTLELATGVNDLGHDLESLLLGDTWSEWISGQVSSDSDSSGGDHGGIGFREVGVGETRSVHAGNVLGLWSVTVVLLNNFVEKFAELGVRCVGTSVEADSGIKVCNSREAASLEADTRAAGLVLVLGPDLLGQVS